MITHWIQVHKETPTKQGDLKKIVKTKTFEALPVQLREKQLKCVVMSCTLISTKKIIQILLPFCGTVNANTESFARIASFLYIRMWTLGVSCVILQLLSPGARWALLKPSCDQGRAGLGDAGSDLWSLGRGRDVWGVVLCSGHCVPHELQPKWLNQTHAQATAWLQEN